MILVHEAHAVRDEGSVVIYEGVAEDESGYGTVWFAVDHSVARSLPAELDALVEEWQVVAYTEPLDRDRDAYDPPDRDPDAGLDAAERRYERNVHGDD